MAMFKLSRPDKVCPGVHKEPAIVISDPTSNYLRKHMGEVLVGWSGTEHRAEH